MRVSTVRLAVLAIFALRLGAAICQAATPQKSASDQPKAHYGYPIDWSSRQLVLAGNSAPKALAAGQREPRHVYNLVRRRVAVDRERHHRGQHLARRRIKVDWAVSLENGYVSQNQYPAKYSFSVTSDDCNKDYALFALTLTSTAGTQANVVGINNLYTGGTLICNGGTPWVAFAYYTRTQTSGQILTSPTPSTEGDKVAFVESSPSGSYFHVLVLPSPIPTPPSHTGTVLAPQTPISCAAPTVVGCMTTVQISAGTDTLASPWIDYTNDTAYVGTDDGKLYKIHPVFRSTAPQVVNDANWPVTVTTGASKVLAGAVLDDSANRIFVGDGNGLLSAIDMTSPAHAVAATQTIGWTGHGAGTGIVDPVLIVNDPANAAVDQVFAFTGCSNVVGIGGAVNQVPANFTNASTYTAVDLGSSDGRGNCTTKNAHLGDFDNTFWNNGSTSGHMIACGFVNSGGAPAAPEMYMFPFNTTTHVLTSTGVKNFQIDSTKGEECSPLTEFYDGTTDRIFYGTGSATTGFFKSTTVTATTISSSGNCTNGSPTNTCVTAPAALGGTSGSIIDNQLSNGGTNIYFSTIAPGDVNGTKCNVTGGTANPYCAVKLTQSTLK